MPKRMDEGTSVGWLGAKSSGPRPKSERCHSTHFIRDGGANGKYNEVN